MTWEQKFIENHQIMIYKSHGAVIKGYVLIPERLYENMDLLAACLEENYQHIMSLPSKKST